jgi:hypothetical protein
MGNNDINAIEYLDSTLYKGTNHFLSISSLIAFIGGRHVVSDLYNHRQDILCNPVVKIIILFSIIYMNIKHVKASIIIFFIYIFLIDNYIKDSCNSEYIENTKK